MRYYFLFVIFILECCSVWELRNGSQQTKLVEVMKFQLSYFKSEKYAAALKIPSNLQNSVVARGLEKVGFHVNPKERQCQRRFELLHNCAHLICWHSNAQILQARLQQCVNCEIPDVQAAFRKARGTRVQIVNICWIIEKASSRKTSISASLTTPKTLTVWITTDCGKFLKRWEFQTVWPAP